MGEEMIIFTLRGDRILCKVTQNLRNVQKKMIRSFRYVTFAHNWNKTTEVTFLHFSIIS